MRAHRPSVTKSDKAMSVVSSLAAVVLAFTLSLSFGTTADETASEAGSYVKQTAVKLAPGVNPQETLGKVLGEYGSKITHSVSAPDGSTLVSVDNPTTGQPVKEFRSQVRGSVGVTQVESNVCLEIYPVLNPNEEITLISPVYTAEQFDQGETPAWSDAGPQVTQNGSPSEPNTAGGTVTREQWEKHKAVGWSTTRGGSVPPEYPYPPYNIPDVCSVPTALKVNPPAIKVALAPSKDQAAQFPYPRPIPLQALVRDYDEIQFACTGCETEDADGKKTSGSNQRLFIEDLIGNYKWEIVGGKGSLNDPFRDLDDGLDKEIEEKKKEIEKKSKELEELKAKKKSLEDSRADREKAIKDKIEKLKQDKAKVEEDIAKLEGEIGQLQEQLDEETRKLNDARKQIEDLEKQIDEKNQRIQELQDKIDGKPSPEERQLQARLEELQNRIDQKKAEFAQLKAQNAQEEQQLRQAYSQAIQNLVTARRELDNLRARVRGTQDQIAALERKLYSSPALYDFITRRANITRLGINLRLQHLGGLPLSPTQQLTQLAQQFFRAPSAQLKQQALDAYAAEQNRLLSQLTQQCQGNPDCLGQVNELAAEANGLQQTLNQAMTNPGSAGSPQDWQALEDKRNELDLLEGQIRAAEQAVTTAEQAVAQAQQTYLEGLTRLEQSEVDLQTEITDLETEADQVAAELAEARRRTEEERLKNTPQWIDEIAQLRKEIEDLERKLADERIKAEAAQKKKLELEAELRDKKEKKKVLERQRDYIDEQIAREEQKLADLDKELEDLEQKIKECEDALEKLKEELAELEKKRKTAATGTRSATGQQAYLIPPPLEETDGFDKKKFEELRVKVVEAEAELEKAKAAKEKLQDDVYKILKGMTEQLWALRAALDASKALGEEIDTLEGEQSTRKADVAKDRTAAAAEERQKKAEREAEKNEKQGALDTAKEAESDQKAMVDSQQKAVEKTAEKVQAAQEKVERYQNAVEENRRLYQQRSRELAQKRTAMDESVSKLRDTESKLSRAKDTLSRAIAREDESGQSSARSEVTRLENELKTVQQEVTTKRAELQQLAGNFGIMQAAHKDVEDTLRQAERDLADWQRKGRLAVTTLQDETSKYDATVEERLLAERRLRQAENDSKAQDEKSKNADEAAQNPDEDDEVKAAQEEIDKKKAEKEKAEQNKTKATNKLDALKQQREAWKGRKTAADQALDDAVKALKDARKALKDFLEKSFKEVEHKIVLKLTLKDMQPDAWRTPDSPTQKTIIIKYEKKRTPDINMEDAAKSLDPPGKLPATQHICQIEAGYPPEPKSNLKVDPKPKRIDGWYEPQTIALFYKKGEPLYDHWPPRKEFKDVLVAAATPFTTGAKDSDDLKASCTVGGGTAISVGVPGTLGDAVGEGSGPQCIGGGSTADAIVDIPHSTWLTRTYNSPTELNTMVNVPEVKPDECKGETELKVHYADSLLQWNDNPDENPKTKKYNRTTGLLGDAPTEYEFETKEDTIELRFQVFDGAHKGKPDQTVEWKVTSIQPADMDEEDYGLNGTEKELPNEKTDGSGYSKVKFTLKKRWGLAKVEAKWKREGTVCDTVTMEIVRPLKLRKIKVGFAPQNGWDQGEEMWKGSNDYEKLAKALPEDGPSPAPSFAVGLMDSQKDPVDEKKIEFSVLEPGSASMKPPEMETKIYGLAWSFATDVPEEANLKMKAKVESTLEPVTEPSEVEGEQSTETQNRFLIGPKGKELIVETDEPFVPGQAYDGGAKLIISGGDIPVEFKTLTLEAAGIMTEEGGGETPVATDGTVTWTVTGAGGKPVKFTVPGFGFEFTLSSLGLTAGSDAVITGKVKVPQREEEIEFEAQFGTEGFYGAASNFPEIEIAKVKLEKGASIIVDMHRGRDPEDVNLRGSWTGKGLVVVSAQLTLPEALKGEAEKPPSISAKDLFFNETGLNGEIDLAYTIAAKLGKIEFAIEHVKTVFAAGSLTAGTFKGKATFAEPWQGAVSLEMNLTSEGEFSFSMGTDKPLTAPSLGLVVQLRKVEGAYANEIFTFTLQGSLRSETFTDFDINNFVIKSTGDIEADVRVRENIEVGKGFEAHLDTFYFKKTETEFALELRDAGFKFKDLLKAENVTVKIGTGPTIKEFELKLEYDKKPVKFNAEIKYKGNSFEGNLGLSVEKLMEVQGIFILGTQETEEKKSFTYWYIELVADLPAPIILGQTGLSITQIGGGLGYNYDPPIGSAGGAARHSDAFSFKASIVVGNVPRGEVFSGRLTMVLVTDRFSLNGKVWLLTKEASLYGEGQLDTYWSPQAKLEGFVRMVIGLADSGGKLLRFEGQVDFRFAGTNDWYVKSRTLEGALLERVIAEGKIDVKPGAANLEGNIRYDLSKEVPLAIVTLQVEVHLRADGKLSFTVTQQSVTLNTRLAFNGSVDLDVETRVKTFDIASATLSSTLTLNANNQSITVTGNARVSWDTWVHSGSTSVDIGFSR